MAISPTGFSGGIQLPVRASQGGGFRLLSGDDYIAQLIALQAGDGDSENPFLDVGFALTAVFANLSDGAWKAQQQRKITELFARLQRAQLAKLVSTAWSSGPKPGEYTVLIRYLSIETNSENETPITLRRR